MKKHLFKVHIFFCSFRLLCHAQLNVNILIEILNYYDSFEVSLFNITIILVIYLFSVNRKAMEIMFNKQ